MNNFFPPICYPSCTAPGTLESCVDYFKSLINEEGTRQTFDTVYIIGKYNLIEPLSKLNLKNVILVPFNLYSTDHKHISRLLRKVGEVGKNKIKIIAKNSVFLLAFEASFITRTSDSFRCCHKFGCEKRLAFRSLEPKAGFPYQLNVTRKVYEAILCCTKLSKRVPTIILPMYPSRVFCDDGSSSDNHKISHTIPSSGFCILDGTRVQWQTYFDFLLLTWASSTCIYHDRNSYSKLMTKIPLLKDTIAINEYLNDFLDVDNNREATLWRMIIATLVELLLKPSEMAIGFRKDDSFKQLEKRSSSYDDGAFNKQKDFVSIKVWNVSESVPEDLLHSFTKAVESSAQIFKTKDYFVIEVPWFQAELIVYKLDNCRIANSTLKASIIGEEDKVIKLSIAQEDFVSSIFNNLYWRFRPLIIENIKKSLSNVFDITNYKTLVCNGHCNGGGNNCNFYHNANDRRRNPLVIKYMQKKCPFQKGISCPNGEDCVFSHSSYEQTFYPTNFQTILCSIHKRGPPAVDSFCKFAHLDTPEVLHTSAWQDCVVFGSQNTFDFFSGAIRGICKLGQIEDVKVCLISNSTDLLDLVDKSFASLFSQHKAPCVNLETQTLNPEFFKVILSTPVTLSFFQREWISPKTVGAMIIDDINGILSDPLTRESLLKIFKKIRMGPGVPSSINKVFVANNCDKEITGVTARYLGLSLTEVVRDATGNFTKTVTVIHEEFEREKMQDDLPNTQPAMSCSPGTVNYGDFRSRSRRRSRSRSRKRSHSMSPYHDKSVSISRPDRRSSSRPRKMSTSRSPNRYALRSPRRSSSISPRSRPKDCSINRRSNSKSRSMQKRSPSPFPSFKSTQEIHRGQTSENRNLKKPSVFDRLGPLI